VTRRQAAWWAAALAASFAVPISSPWVGVLRDVAEARLGGRYLSVLAFGLGAVAVTALAIAVASIRTRRLPRYALLLLVVALTGLQPLLWGQGIRRVDLVERVHLVEYSGIAFLYFLALRSRVRDGALPILAVLAATYVGVADETIQWLSSMRVGDIRDVLLNGWAGAIGAAFALALALPGDFRWRPEPSSLGAIRRSATLLLLVGAALFSHIGVGTVIHDPRAGAFVSHFDAAGLLRARDQRAVLWASSPPAAPAPLVREDPFLSEAGFHKATRDRAAADGRARRAWLENRILERWYAPYLALRSFETGAPNRWSEDQRTAIRGQARRHGGLVPGPARSPAAEDRLTPVPRSLLWAAVLLAAAAGLWGGGRHLERRLGVPTGSAGAGKVRPVDADRPFTPGRPIPTGKSRAEEE